MAKTSVFAIQKVHSTLLYGGGDRQIRRTKTIPTIVDNVDGTTSTQPVWAEGDEILLADGTATETYTVTAAQAENSVITITTSHQGTVTAVYPADAAIKSGNDITGVKVLAEQDSTFANANICMAEEQTKGSLSFQNKTAVFKVKVPAHTAQLVVTSLGEIDGATGRRGETVRPINTEGVDDAAKQKITVSLDETKDAPTTCYVAVLVDATNPVLLTNLNFDAASSATAGTQGGFSPKYLKEVKEVAEPYSLAVAASTVYNLPEEALHPYISVNGYKWATCNIGATQPSEPGYYFQFAGTTGYTEADKNKTAVYMYGEMSIFTAQLGGMFPDATPGGYTKYTPDGAQLELTDDAASYCWGGAWRIPLKSDIVGAWGDLFQTTGKFTRNSDNLTTIEGVSFYFHEYLFNSEPMAQTASFTHQNGYLFLLAETIQSGGSRAATLRVDESSAPIFMYSIQQEDRAAGIPVRPVSH